MAPFPPIEQTRKNPKINVCSAAIDISIERDNNNQRQQQQKCRTKQTDTARHTFLSIRWITHQLTCDAHSHERRNRRCERMQTKTWKQNAYSRTTRAHIPRAHRSVYYMKQQCFWGGPFSIRQSNFQWENCVRRGIMRHSSREDVHSAGISDASELDMGVWVCCVCLCEFVKIFT